LPSHPVPCYICHMDLDLFARPRRNRKNPAIRALMRGRPLTNFEHQTW